MSGTRIRPETNFAAVGDTDIAYQVIGDAPTDLLSFSPIFSTQAIWNVTSFLEFTRRLVSVCRVIHFDPRGSGASDLVPHTVTATWESLAEDAGAVLDAVGSSRAAILASAEAGPAAMLFAATHPDRVSALILLNSYARYTMADDYPIGVGPDVVDWISETAQAQWGRGWALLAQPSLADDPAALEQMANYYLSVTTPRRAAAHYAYFLRDIDAREVLPLISAPSLVVQTRGNRFVPMEHGQYLAEHIAGARRLIFEGSEYFPQGENADRLVDEIGELLTGHRPIDSDQVLATVLFTDIVDSTATAAAMGDRRWRSLLDAHDGVVRDQLRRFGGREIKTTGDGFVATFTGPARAIRCAQAITEATRSLGVDIRAGVHTGECEIHGDDLAGVAVHIAARVSALAARHEVLVSSTVKDLVIGSAIDFDDRGEHELKGVPGSWRLYAAL